LELQLFSSQSGRSLEWYQFQEHELGRLYQTIPFRELAAEFPSSSGLGRTAWFSIAGGIGLQILKKRYGVSDKKLIELLNENAMMQLFCGIRLKLGQRIRDDDIVGRWRKFLGEHLPLKALQEVLSGHWAVQLEQPNIGLSDATCYESYVRYPTDVKLLWECCDWLWDQICRISQSIGRKLERVKFKEQYQKYLRYQKRRKKSRKLERRRRKALLYLLKKLQQIMSRVLAAWTSSDQWDKIKLAVNFFSRLGLIKRVYKQQKLHYDRPEAQIKGRIVSLAKPYLRPIVRGKETKRVEFGMKVNMLQVDNINFIEHADFEAFHEGVRLKNTIWTHRHYFSKITHVGADLIYANNANRRYCTAQGITTSFPRKGRAGKNEAQAKIIRAALQKARATRMEGSFGNEKNHYGLGKVKAKTKATEMAWIFFGILTANAHKMMKKWAKAPPD
jgi:hypothetical protein